MDVLLVQNEPDEVRERVGFAIESRFHARVHEAITLKAALDLIDRLDRPIDLILFDWRKVDDPSGQAMFWSKNRTTPTIFFDSDSPERASAPPTGEVKTVGHIGPGQMLEQLLPLMDDLIRTEVLKRDESDIGYVRIRTRLLLSVSPLKGDVFLRLSNSKFLKIFNEGDSFERADFEKYTNQKSIQYLYIKEGTINDFIDKYKHELLNLLKSAPLAASAAMKIGEEAHETVQELIRTVGFNT